MAEFVKTPSLQHTVGLMADTVGETELNIRRLIDAQISITLKPGRRLFKPLMEGIDVDWALSQCELEQEKNIAPNKGLVEAFSIYAKEKNVPWFKNFPDTYYPIRSGLLIPVNPNGFWFQNGAFHVLWVQSWKGRTLTPLQKSIFNTVLHKAAFVDDFHQAKLEWVDLCEQVKGSGRGLEVLTAEKLGLISESDLSEYFEIYLKADAAMSDYRAEKRAKDREKRKAKDIRREAPLLDWNPEGPE